MHFVFAVNGWYLGGFVTFCRNLSAGLRRQGHRVTLLIPADASVGRCVEPGGFDQCLGVPRGLSRVNSYVQRVAREVDRLNPEVLVVNDCPYGMAALPFIRPEILRLPVIHNVEPDEIELGLSNEQWWERVIAVSDCVAKAVEARGFRERLSVCPYGVPLPPPNGHALSPRRGPALRLVTVSRIVVRQKRLERLPGIARLLAEQQVDYHWEVLGSGDYLLKLRQTVKECGLGERFTFRGSVPAAGVAEALAQADAFVMTSDYEGLPQALLEAMAHGVVPVVSRIEGSTTCAVTPGVSGFLCNPGRAEDYAEAIRRLAQEPVLRAKLGLAAADTIAREFSLEAFTQRFLGIVEAVRARGVRRTQALPLSRGSLRERPFRCLSFWRSLRHQTLGQAKQRFLQAARRLSGPDGALGRRAELPD